MSDSETTTSTLPFPFRDSTIDVTFDTHTVPLEHAQQALLSEPFGTWIRRCERTVQVDATTQHQLNIQSVQLQSVDLFGPRGVGFVKLKAHATLTVIAMDAQTGQVVSETHSDKALPGICLLRGAAVSLLVALFVEDEDINDDNKKQVYSLLVEQPRVPIGQVACLELPAGMVDNETATIGGIAVQELREECGITVDLTDLVDLTELALDRMAPNRLPGRAVPPSPGGCDEVVRYFYLEKKVTPQQLEAMKGRLQGLREHGEYITLRVVPLEDVWKLSGDNKAMISLFLLDQLRKEETLPEAGCLATPLEKPSNDAPVEPRVSLPTISSARDQSDSNAQQSANDASSVFSMPQLAFGLYQVPDNESGAKVISDAIAAGYRHFDSAEFYGNEATLGQALRSSDLQRSEFFITAKVWKTTLVEGPRAVKESIQTSLDKLAFEGADAYVDLAMIHWPVAGHFVAAYQALQELHQQGLVKSIGLSNFNIQEYEELMASGFVKVPPVCNQMEVSPVMYRPDLTDYYQQKARMIVVAFKPLQRGALLDQPILEKMAQKYRVSVAQLVLRWSLQHGFVAAAKTLSFERMKENRRVWHFTISHADMIVLDGLTKHEDVVARTERERQSKLVG